MLRLSIVQDDMLHRDKRALKILSAAVDPQTQRSTLNVNELAYRLRCHPNTAGVILHRLEGAGTVKLHKTRGRQGAEIEVLSTAAEIEVLLASD